MTPRRNGTVVNVCLSQMLLVNRDSLHSLVYVYCKSTIGYEPADLTVHPPPPELPRVGSFFFRIGV